MAMLNNQRVVQKSSSNRFGDLDLRPVHSVNNVENPWFAKEA